MRAYFESCLLLGKLLRGATYSTTRIVDVGGTLEVRKRRASFAPVLVALGDPLVVALDTGVTVLAQAEWEQRERRMFETLYGKEIRVEPDGTLILPHLAGKTLATLLEERSLGVSVREKAIELAVRALAELHAKTFTHADAMAENVMIALDGDAARWFDFETVHDAARDETWCRADDVRALLATCLLRTPISEYAQTIDRVFDAYGDRSILRHVAASFSSAQQRVLVFHLGQAPLPYESFVEIGRLLNTRLA